MSYRIISARGMVKPDATPIDRGPKPDWAWIRIALLRVNDVYQRPLRSDSIKSIRRIAAEFNWIKFGAVTVAPLADTDPQLYAVVNGQHRATAAALLGITEVPCIVIEADEATQAAAFAAINGNVVRALGLTTFRAQVAAGDPAALALTKLCEKVGVEICAYPIQNSQMKAGQTLAIGTLQNAVKRFGAPVLSLALRCITETSNNLPGAVHANAVQALCEIIGALPKPPAAGPFIAQFEAIELDTLDSDSRAEKPRFAGDTARARLRDKIKGALEAQRVAA